MIILYHEEAYLSRKIVKRKFNFFYLTNVCPNFQTQIYYILLFHKLKKACGESVSFLIGRRKQVRNADRRDYKKSRIIKIWKS